jgi:uncharacterized phage protein gp47/JayE
VSYGVRSFETILDAMLADWRNRVPGLNTAVDTEVYIRTAVVAGALWGLECGLKFVENQIFPDTADFVNLKRWAATYDITPTPPQAASDGTITLTGVNTTIVASGLVLAHEDGTTYTTTSGGTIASGILAVAATCDDAGASGNKSAGTVLTVQAPPAGVDATASITTGFANGADDETQAHLLARVLNRIRQGNAGGTANDYEQWALSITGVSFAYALPLRRGAGTVDVAVFGIDGDGHRLPTTTPTRDEVLDYIDTVRPVTADVQVPAVTLVPIDVVVNLTVLEDGVELADVCDAVEAAMREYVYSIRPGGTFYLTQLMRTVAAVDGVIDFEVTVPTGNATSTVDAGVVEVFEPATVVAS